MGAPLLEEAKGGRMIEDYINLCNRIAAEYEAVYGAKPSAMSALMQFDRLTNLFDEYRENFGTLNEVCCPKCHNFFDDFGDCWCEEEANEQSI